METKQKSKHQNEQPIKEEEEEPIKEEEEPIKEEAVAAAETHRDGNCY